ncbi:putative thioesterase [Streptomyces spiroverticillatus]|uniref:Thioesterase n=1 Tax=Streptomyces finlayi TaxID=67296 RepID=A0A918X529_9ACTN|nr:alpha/beta fold hydrolase [Streptomyces finlayi]GHA35670.1 putative thioesterase [Streptomyces spiroverticillatus]GHD12678.1 putative thioesterase [Streptomyces finlayi]
MRLVCFAHAGAGTSAFRRWNTLLADAAHPEARTLPGREARRRETRVTTRQALLADLHDLFAPRPPGPYILYGHSLGGLVAYTLTRALHAAGLPLPALLAVGACPPPGDPGELISAAEAPDHELLRVLEKFEAVPEDTVPGDVWHRLVLPVLRDDLRLAADLRAAALDPATGGPVPLPLLAVGGSTDALVPAETMHGWRAFTGGRFVHRTLPGGHFFVRDDELPRLLGRACRIVGRTTR